MSGPAQPSPTGSGELSPDPQPGDRLGSYELGEALGQGAMGRVYRARHLDSGAEVAIKVVLRDYAHSAEAMKRAVNEARAVSAVQHPSIVRVLDAGNLPDGRPWFATEVLAGTPLYLLIAERGRLSVDEALEVLTQAMSGIEAAHAVGVVHRDLKPENIFVDTAQKPWRVTVLDFGLALHLSEEATRLTQTGVVMGTPAYMAPEMFHGERALSTPGLDVYAMGMVAWAMLSGRPPFKGSSMAQLMYQHINATVPPLRSVAPDVPEALEALVARMVEKAPEARPTAAEVRADLEALRRGIPLPGSSRRRPGGRAGSSKRAVLSVAVGGAVGAVLATTLWVGLRSEPEAPPPAAPLAAVAPAAVATPPRPSPAPPPVEAPLDAGAPAAAAPPAPASPPLPEGTRWPCRKLLEATPVYRGVGETGYVFQARFDGEPPLLVYGNMDEQAAVKRVQKAVLGCKGRLQLLVVESPQLYNLWWTEGGPMLKGGFKAPVGALKFVAAPPSPSARLWSCERLAGLGPLEKAAAGSSWSFAVKFADAPTLLVTADAARGSRGPPELAALRAQILACRGKARQVLAEGTVEFTDWKSAKGRVVAGGLRAEAAAVDVRAVP